MNKPDQTALGDQVMLECETFCNGIRERLGVNVQVFCTYLNEDGTGKTGSVNISRGDWFSTYGRIIDWLIEQKEATRRSVQMEMEKGEDEEP